MVRSAEFVFEGSQVRVPAGAAGESLGSAFCSLILVSVPPHVTAEAKKKKKKKKKKRGGGGGGRESQSFCQKGKWQVTAKTHIHTTHVASGEVT